MVFDVVLRSPWVFRGFLNFFLVASYGLETFLGEEKARKVHFRGFLGCSLGYLRGDMTNRHICLSIFTEEAPQVLRLWSPSKSMSKIRATPIGSFKNHGSSSHSLLTKLSILDPQGRNVFWRFFVT